MKKKMEDLNQEDATKTLVFGIQNGDLQQVREALQKEVNLKVLTDCPDGISRTLLGLAAYLGHGHIIQPLVAAGVDVNGRGSRFFPPLIHAARERHTEVMRELIKAKANINAIASSREVSNSVLHTSIMKDDAESVALLLAQDGIIVSPRDDFGYTPLHVAARRNNLKTLNCLVCAGAELHSRTIHGWTPLHIASMSGSLDAVKRLLELKLDHYSQDNESRTPSDLADELGRTDVYWFFIKKAGQAEKLVLTPPHKSEKRYDIESMMLDWAKDGSDRVLPMLRLNQPEPFDGYYQDSRGYTTLHYAAEKGHLKVVKLLLEECLMYAGVRDRKDRTPADIAREQGHMDLASFIESHFSFPKNKQESEALYLELLELISQCDDVKKASMLLFKGTPIEATGQHSADALCLAITANRRRILTLLIAAGVPMTTVSQGLNILQIAWISPHVSTYVRMIITRIMAYILEEEISRVDRCRSELKMGAKFLLERVQSDTPWHARWPDAELFSVPSDLQKQTICSKKLNDPSSTNSQKWVYLTHLMVQAVEANCSMITAFLQQAGGVPFAVDIRFGVSPFTMALKCKYWNIARQIAKNSNCLYIADSSGILPKDLLPKPLQVQFENEIFDRESRKICDVQEKVKNDIKRINELKGIKQLQNKLYESYKTNLDLNNVDDELMALALLLASQLGLSQLVFLIDCVTHFDINTKLEPLMYTSALHHAAAFGHSDLCMLLLSRGALIHTTDRFNHSPPHFAAMFGHHSTYQYISACADMDKLLNNSNNSPDSIYRNFYNLLDHYNVLEDFIDQGDEFFTCNDPAQAEREKLEKMSLSHVVQQSSLLCVNFLEEEEAELKNILMKELHKIIDLVAVIDPIYTGGTLELLGSTADNTRLHAPDEFDFNFSIDLTQRIEVQVVNLENNEASLRGHSKDLKVTSKDKKIKSLLRNSNWKENFYMAVSKCLENYSFSDQRLSLVPPGATTTQVGICLSLSWQGIKYPLLLVGVDLVPVLKIDWPEEVERPYLMAGDNCHTYISNIGDGKWRPSFANLETCLLKSLQADERRVYMTSKTLLACMKAEPWMPKTIKNKFTWWNTRRWKIQIPSGFALKNCFLRRLEDKRRCQEYWEEDKLAFHMKSVFKLMVEEEFYSMTKVTELVATKIKPYFGKEFEKPKLGEGSLEIIKYLEKCCQS